MEGSQHLLTASNASLAGGSSGGGLILQPWREAAPLSFFKSMHFLKAKVPPVYSATASIESRPTSCPFFPSLEIEKTQTT